MFAALLAIPAWLLLILPLELPTVSAECFSRDRVPARNSVWFYGPEMVSCGNNTNNCCMSGESCGTNLLCRSPAGVIARQYCADKDWSKCSLMCVGQHPSAGAELTDCGRNIFCCGGNNTDCCSKSQGFFIDPNNGDMRLAATASGVTASPTWWSVDSVSLLAAMSTAASSATMSLGPVSLTTTTVTSAATASMSAPTPSTVSPPVASAGMSAGAGAGIGIGCTVVVMGGIFGALYLLWKRKKEREMHELAERMREEGYANCRVQIETYGHAMPVEMKQPDSVRELGTPYMGVHELK